MRKLALLFLFLPFVALSFACDAQMPVEPEAEVPMIFASASEASAKELYVSNFFNHLRAYEILHAPEYLTPVRESQSPQFEIGRDLAMDSDSEVLFVAAVSGSGYPEITVVDAKTLQRIGQYQFASGPLGRPRTIAYDHNKKEVYFLIQGTVDLHVLSWDATTRTLSLAVPEPYKLLHWNPRLTLYGVDRIDVDEINERLYVSVSSFVLDYDTSDLTKRPRVVPASGASCQAGGPVAVDVQREFIYVSGVGAYDGFCQISLSTGVAKKVVTPGVHSRPNGIAVNPATGLVYVTNVGGGGSSGAPTRHVLVYDAELNLLHSGPNLFPEYPYGIVVSSRDILLHTTVSIDIKPGGDPNCVNPTSGGRIAVAILDSQDYDLSTIDPSVVSMEGVSPVMWAFNKDVGGGADPDLVFQFNTRDLNAAGVLTDGNTLTLTGNLLDGTPIEGSDVVYLAGGPNCLD